jgi:protein TonB
MSNAEKQVETLFAEMAATEVVSFDSPAKRRRGPLTWVFLAIVAIVLVGGGVWGVRALTADEPAAPEVSASAPAQAATSAPEPAPEVPSTNIQQPPPEPVADQPASVHEEIPEVSARARQGIRGHIRVSVRVIVDKQGNVFAALVDQTGPSRYLERLAIEAAKKWTFPPSDDQQQRLMVVRFDFTRDGASAHAAALE